MAIHTDDLLEKLDRALATQALPPATSCGLCSTPLNARSPSLDFCGQECQDFWHSAKADRQAPDLGRGLEYEGSVSVAEQWTAMGLGWAHQRQIRLIERENEQRLRRLESTYMRVMTEREVITDSVSYVDRFMAAAARWFRLDPDS